MSARKKATASGPKATSTARPSAGQLPNVGEVLRRLRMQRGLSVRDIADACGISQSFLSMVERGSSDISLRRLAKIADFFEHDIGSLLGYTTRLAKPHFITEFERSFIDRGPGIDYEVILLPGLEIELNIMKLGPKSAFADAISHEGFDVLYMIKGQVMLVVSEIEYPLSEGQCVFYSSAFSHRLVNRSARPAVVLGVTTGHMVAAGLRAGRT